MTTQVVPLITLNNGVDMPALFDFAFTPDEVASIDALDTGARRGPDPELVDQALHLQGRELTEPARGS